MLILDGQCVDPMWICRQLSEVRGGRSRDLLQQTRGCTKAGTGLLFCFTLLSFFSQIFFIICKIELENMHTKCIITLFVFHFHWYHQYCWYRCRCQWACLLQEWNALLKSFLCPQFSAMRSLNKSELKSNVTFITVIMLYQNSLWWGHWAKVGFFKMKWNPHHGQHNCCNYHRYHSYHDHQVCEASLPWERQCWCRAVHGWTWPAPVSNGNDVMVIMMIERISMIFISMVETRTSRDMGTHCLYQYLFGVQNRMRCILGVALRCVDDIQSACCGTVALGQAKQQKAFVINL